MLLRYSRKIVCFFFPIKHLPWSRGQGLLQQWICTARTPKEWNAGGYTSSHSPTHPHLPRNPRTSPGLPRTAVQLYWVTKKMKPKLEYANSKGHRNNKWSIQENYNREENSKQSHFDYEKRANNWQSTNQPVLNKPWGWKDKVCICNISYSYYLARSVPPVCQEKGNVVPA